MAVTEQNPRFVIIGAGMAGILAAIKLKGAGFENISVYEKADRIGGTWRENRYPGLTCDVPSHSYTYEFAPNPEWTQALPPGAEIQSYFEGVVEQYEIEPLIRFNEAISRCHYDESTAQWQLESERGREDKADFVIAATGVLHHPRLPDIPGLDSFEGECFHSACWPDELPLDGKRIAVIGSGSTGVQIISALAGRAEQLSHFCRSVQWIMPVENPAFTEQQKAAFRADPELMANLRHDPTLEANIERSSEAIVDPDSEAMQTIENLVRDNLEQSVLDPDLRERLRPNYRAACKRLIYSPDYYQAIQHPRAALVTEDIAGVEAKGIRTADGQLHEVDIIVLATGFQADQFMRPMSIQGRSGRNLEALWQNGPLAYMAVSLPDFPNFFMLNGPNGPVGNFSLIEIAERQWEYIEQLISRVRSDESARGICASTEALQQFDAERVAAAKRTVFATGCSSWYLDQNGVPATWPWTRSYFTECMAEPRWTDFELTV